jgi:hypothetical protein
MVAARWLRFGCQLAAMVSVVQLVEHQVVILGVAGSSPVTHPTGQRWFSDPSDLTVGTSLTPTVTSSRIRNAC